MPLEIKSVGFLLGCLPGMTFAAVTVALYNAFEIGPVRVVASIIGAYTNFLMIWTDLRKVNISA